MTFKIKNFMCYTKCMYVCIHVCVYVHMYTYKNMKHET
jgi:hypothetical protein